MECRRAQQLLWMDADDPHVLAHLDHCSPCRSAGRQLAELKLALAELGAEEADVPADLEGAILAAIERRRLERALDLVSHPRFWRNAAVGAAAAAAAFGLIVAHRHVRPDLAA